MSGASSPPGVVFLGMPCAASASPLRALLSSGLEVRAVLLAGRRTRGSGIERVARAAGVPVLEVPTVATFRRPGLLETIASLRPDALAVACFPWRLPPALLALPPLGCLNVHPSLLPAGRGPQPVFWTLRRGERRTGATVHLMDEGFDTGPIVARAAIEVPLGERAGGLEARLMTLGGRLLVEAIPALAAGRLVPVPQDDALATGAPVPTTDDFAVPTNLPARWAYGFVRGVAALGGPLELRVLATGQRFPLADALDYQEDGVLPAPVEDQGHGVLRVRFRPGTASLTVRRDGG